MKRSEHRILTTHVGSIVRPPRLRELAGMSMTSPSPENKKEFEDALTDAVAEVVQLQAKAGIDIVNDGEFGKSSWSNYILERISGFEHRDSLMTPLTWLGRDLLRFPDVMEAEFPWGLAGAPADVCVGPVKYTNPAPMQRDIRNLKAALRHVKVEEAFLPVVAPQDTMTVEHPRLVADRIVPFARLVGREIVIAGTDCGFAQGSFVVRQ